MTFEPIKPAVHHPPLKVADDTWLIQQMQRAVIGPLWVYLHSLVINDPSRSSWIRARPSTDSNGWKTSARWSIRAMCGGSSFLMTTSTTPATWCDHEGVPNATWSTRGSCTSGTLVTSIFRRIDVAG